MSESRMQSKGLEAKVLHADEIEASDRRWAQPPKPTSPENAAAYLEVAAGGEVYAEPSGTLAEARRRGEVIPDDEDDEADEADED
ncbi:MAG: hypothetical protein ACRDJO_08760 [Actinomycetota bacterium]